MCLMIKKAGFILGFIFVVLQVQVNAQNHWLNDLSEELGTFEKNYLYPSVLRALNNNQSQAFDQLIEGLQVVRVLRLDSTFILENKELLTPFPEALLNDGYEEVAQWNAKHNSRRSLFIREDEKRIQGIIVSDKQARHWLMVEWVGKFDPKELSALLSTDFDPLNDFVGLDLIP